MDGIDLSHVFEALRGLPQVGSVIVVENPIDKRFMISQTEHLNHWFYSFEEQIKNGLLQSKLMTQDIDKLKIRILGKTDDIIARKLWCNYFNDEYMKMGWTCYSKRVFTRLRPGLLVFPRLNLVQVVLKNSRGENRVVGCFDSVIEAKEFIKVSYNKTVNKYNLPAIAINQQTREYLESTAVRYK
jgi:hypothetical protein